MSYKNELIESLDNLCNAFFEVHRAIEKGDNNGEDFSSFISHDYPFDLSFDEIFFKVISWRDTIIEDAVLSDGNGDEL